MSFAERKNFLRIAKLHFFFFIRTTHRDSAKRNFININSSRDLLYNECWISSSIIRHIFKRTVELFRFHCIKMSNTVLHFIGEY